LKRQAITLIVLAALIAAMPLAAQLRTVADKDNQSQVRDLTGLVVAKASDAPLADAIVYLKNSKTHAIKTYITANDGRYRFPALAMNTDYEIYAEHEGKRSDTKTLSSFDSRRQASITLRIDSTK
jgi:hypothetical protein